MNDREIELRRDCRAVEIPAGDALLLRKGSIVKLIRNSTAGCTVMTDYGFLARIASSDLDALGIATEETQRAEGQLDETLVWSQLREVYDPEIPVNIVELGLVYDCRITRLTGGARVDVTMTLTAPGCGVGELLKEEIEQRILSLPGIVEASVEIVFDPPWTPERMTAAARLALGM